MKLILVWWFQINCYSLLFPIIIPYVLISVYMYTSYVLQILNLYHTDLFSHITRNLYMSKNSGKLIEFEEHLRTENIQTTERLFHGKNWSSRVFCNITLSSILNFMFFFLRGLPTDENSRLFWSFQNETAKRNQVATWLHFYHNTKQVSFWV